MKTEITSSVELVTPFLAEKWLELNVCNRPLSNSTVQIYADAMRRNEWRLNGESIIFFADRSLGNGQHRLSAIIRSGVSQQIVVTRGVQNDTFHTLDGGKRRGSGDVLTMRGEKNSKHLGAAIRSCLVYLDRGLVGKSITAAQVTGFLDRNQGIRAWVSRCKHVGDTRLAPSSLTAYVYLASLAHPAEILEEFLEKLFSGVGLQKGDAALALRSRLLTTGSASIVRTARDAFIVKALSAHLACRKVGILKWSEGETFPTIYGTEAALS